MKQCATCKTEKTLSNFSKNRSKKDGFKEQCKDCVKDYNFINREYIRKRNLEYFHNKGLKLQNKNRSKRRLEDPMFKLTSIIRGNIIGAIKRQGYSKKSKTYQILGCDFETFKLHIEKQFTDGMSWSNQGEWHLDHIYPVSLARDEKHLLELNHYTNFQPLWAADNIRKGNKLI